jgi:2,5-diketo-D-gluconate reductase A
MSEIPTVGLRDGNQIPQFGFGVFQIPPGETVAAVRTALEAGYRHIDTAQMYGNEAEVGQAIADSGLAREDLFITTKANNDRHGYDEALRSLNESLDKLGLEYVNLFLIHWPQPQLNRYVETWRALEKASSDGLARSIGVSNFQPPHLDKLRQETSTVPAVDQIELHPYLQQKTLREYDQNNDIVTEAWSPLAKGEVSNDTNLVALAEKYGKAASQVVLRWHIQLGNVVFPKSVTPSRIRSNIDIFDFELSEDDMAAINNLDTGRRMGPNPDTMG